jgi:hypothetical protein
MRRQIIGLLPRENLSYSVLVDSLTSRHDYIDRH